MEHGQFSHASKNETRFLAVAKKLNETEDSNFSKVQATLEIKMTKPKENINVDQDLNVLEKWLMGVTYLQLYNTVWNITERNIELAHYIAGYFKHKPVDFEKLRKHLAQNTLADTLRKNVQFAFKNGNVV